MDALEQNMKKIFLKSWDKLMLESVLHQYHKDQVLFYESHLPYGIFVILSGSVMLVNEDKDGNPIEVSASLFNPIGFDILFAKQKYPFTAVARSDVKALFIPKSSLDLLCRHCSEGE